MHTYMNIYIYILIYTYLEPLGRLPWGSWHAPDKDNDELSARRQEELLEAFASVAEGFSR